MNKSRRSEILREDLFWFGEKMRQGYESVAPNPEAALNLYKAAAVSGFPRAYLRLGKMYERGIGTAVDPRQALEAYQTATAKGEIIGYSAMARPPGLRNTRRPSFFGIASSKSSLQPIRTIWE